MDVGSLVRDWGRGRAQANKVERELERSSNSGDTANNTSTINGAAVPSVSSSVHRASTKTELVPRSLAAIETALLRNRWKCSTPIAL